MRTESLPNGRRVLVDDTCAFGTDAILLSNFCSVHPTDRVCDLGTGCGIIPFLWFSGGTLPSVDAVELSPSAADLARRSAEQNGLSHRFHVIEQDWRQLALPHNVYDVVVSNPPYFAVGSGKVSDSPERRLARHESETTLSDVIGAARLLLRVGGRFCLCHRPERLPDVLIALRNNGLEPKRLQWVHARADLPPFLFLCEAVKGGRAWLTVLPPHILESR